MNPQGRMSNLEARIVGEDPGLITGLATAHIKLDESGLHVTQFGYELGWDETADALEHLLRLGRYDVVAVERYVITNRTAKLTQQPEALEMIGATRSACRRYSVPMILQSKSDADTICSDRVLKSIGWYQRTKDGHANDASRQVLLALSAYAPRLFQELLRSGKAVVN